MRCNKARQEIIWERHHGAGSVVPFSLQAGNDIFFRFYLTKAEAAALTWSDIDYKQNVIHVTKTATFNEDNTRTTGTPKSESGKRDIPLNDIGQFQLIQHLKRIVMDKDKI